MVYALAAVGRCEEAIAAARRLVEATRIPDQQDSRWGFENL